MKETDLLPYDEPMRFEAYWSFTPFNKLQMCQCLCWLIIVDYILYCEEWTT